MSPNSKVKQSLVNQPESKSFLASAFAWHGSVTPLVLPRVLWTSAYTVLVMAVTAAAPWLMLPVTPFEYSGALLGMILVVRVNSGHDRWWEARKIWGSIVNQSRNLSIIVSAYSGKQEAEIRHLLNLLAAWPHVMRESLRQEQSLLEVSALLGEAFTAELRAAENMSMLMAVRIGQGLGRLRINGMDAMAFHRAETERAALIDAIGACERIRNTRMPLVLAIKTRRFIGLFLLLLPLAIVDRAGLATPLVIALAAYPLFSLDEIGAELQNPFSTRNLSHLPLDAICRTISSNVLGLLQYREKSPRNLAQAKDSGPLDDLLQVENLAIFGTSKETDRNINAGS